MNKNLTKEFTIADGGFACLVFICLQYIIYQVLIFIAQYINNSTVATILLYIFSFILELAFAAASYVIAYMRKTDFGTATTIKSKFNWGMVGITAAIAFVCLFAFSDLTSAFVCMLQKFGYTSVVSDIQINHIGDYLINVFLVCIMPAICEEILFRGVVLNSLRKAGKWVSIIVSAFAFMIMHGNPDQTIHQLILGVILGLICFETRNIWATILIHFFNNFFALTASAIMQLFESSSQAIIAEISWGSIAMSLGIGIVTSTIGIFFIVYLLKHLKKQSEKANTTTEETTTTETDATITSSLEIVDETNKKTSKKQVIITIITYLAFSAYFIVEWINALLTGFGL